MINLRGLFDGLLFFFENYPSGTRAMFVNGVVNQEIDTAANANLFLDRFLEVAVWFGYLSDDDFAELMTKASAVGLAKATNAASIIYRELLDQAEFRVIQLQLELDEVNAQVAAFQEKIDHATQGRSYILANFPAGATRDDTVEAIEAGGAAFAAARDAFQFRADKLISQIERLGISQIERLGGEVV